MIPSKKFFYLLLIPAPFFILNIIMDFTIWIGILLAITIVIVSISDYVFSSKQDLFKIKRDIKKLLSVGIENSIKISVKNETNKEQEIIISDDIPVEGKQSEDIFKTIIKPRNEIIWTYNFTPHKRGQYFWNKINIRFKSKMGFWWFQREIEYPNEVKIYPNIKAVSKYNLLARQNRLNEMGFRLSRLRGSGNEFERLRDYREDDDFSKIDWSATARLKKLISREYQVEKNQHIFFMLDCGRSMLNEVKGISYLDYTLNSILMLSYIALSQGDYIGMATFSNKIHNYFAPKKGKNSLKYLIHGTYNIFPDYVESDYETAFSYLNVKLNKRSLIILLTNILDETNADIIHKYYRMLSKKHLPLCVLIADHTLHDLVDSNPNNSDIAYQTGAASELLLWRETQIKRFKQDGINTLDVFPEDMTPIMINKYLEIKSKTIL